MKIARPRPLYFWLALGALVLAVLVLGEVRGFYSTTVYTCSHCRAERQIHSYFGFNIPLLTVTQTETDYTRWYEKTQPPHEHHWCWCGSHHGHRLFVVVFACGWQHPVWQVFPAAQKHFVETASPAELQQFYSLLDAADHKLQQQGADMANAKFDKDF